MTHRSQSRLAAAIVLAVFSVVIPAQVEAKGSSAFSAHPAIPSSGSSHAPSSGGTSATVRESVPVHETPSASAMGRRPGESPAVAESQPQSMGSAMGRRPGEVRSPVQVPPPIVAPSVPSPQVSAMGRRPGEVGSSAAVNPSTAGQSVFSARQGTLEKAANRQASTSAMKRYDGDKARATMPAPPVDVTAARQNPLWNQAHSNYATMDGYYAARDREMGDYRRRYPNTAIYVHNMRPHYGAWDGFFMGMLLSDLTRPDYPRWAYAHQADPDYVQWHQDAVAQANQNADMREKLARLDQQVADMKAQGAVPQAANVLPDGMSPAVALAPEAMMSDVNPAETHHWFRAILETLICLAVLAVLFLVALHHYVRRTSRA